ncbi:hypothetical protein LJK87_35870 [Paenibacillus sp. P25]|nr:hypothetical protein LJK87_35870 [Paenibacillus sp. P25]
MPRPLENYLNLRDKPFQLSIRLNRTASFTEIFHAHQGIEMLYVHEGEGEALFERRGSRFGRERWFISARFSCTAFI